MRSPGIEPGSTAWKAAMLTTIPPTHVEPGSTRVNCLEGSYARHYTTNACGGCWLARSVRMLEAHESLTGLEELKRSLFGPGTKDQGLDPGTYEKALSFHAG